MSSCRASRPRPPGWFDRELLFSRSRARQQQIRDIGARDQQDQSHRAEQEQQRGPNRPDHRFLPVLQRNADPALAESLVKVLRDDRQVGAADGAA